MTIDLIQKELDAKLESIFSRSRSKATLEKLKAISDICSSFTKNGSIPRIKNTVVRLNDQGISLSARSFYNERKTGNLYREMVDAWSLFASAKGSLKSQVKNSGESSDSQEIVTNQELLKIDDHVLRYRLTLMIGELKGLRNQLNMLKQIQNLPPLIGSGKFKSFEIPDSSNQKPISLDPIKSFIKQCNAFDLDFDESGALISVKPIRRGESLSEPGLKGSLLAVINELDSRR